MKQAFFGLIFAILVSNLAEGKQQCMTVRGRAKCGAGSANDPPIFIKLVDEDSVRADDDMDETHSSKISGAFQLRGCASDPVGNIDPELHIYHNCKGRGKLVTIVLPESAIGKEHNVTDVINLLGNFPNEVDYDYKVPKCATKFRPSSLFYFF